MNLGSWKDEFELKLLVKVKLNDNGYKLDYIMERDLENFIKLKQKRENAKQLTKPKGAKP